MKILLFGVLSVAWSAGGWAQTLNPSLVPGQNFDLSHWKLQLPTSPTDPNALLSLHTGVTEIMSAALKTYTSSYFYTDPVDGAMRFYAPITGSTTSGSDYPRSELREIFSSTSNDWLSDYGTAVLTASVKINQVPSTKKVIFGQIHGDVPNAVMTILEYTNGVITADLNYSPLVDKQVRLAFPSVGLVPTDLISYQLKMVPGAVLATVNGVTQVMTIDPTKESGWGATTLYFKAGDYCIGNPTTEGFNPPANDGAGTAFYSLKIDHVTSNLTISQTALPDGIVGVPYRQTLQTTGSNGAVLWSLANGVVGIAGGGYLPTGPLPPGLSLSSGGVISGTPDSSATNKNYPNIVIQAIDAGGATAVQVIGIKFGTGLGNVLPAIGTQPVGFTAAAGQTGVLSVGANGTGLNYQWKKGVPPSGVFVDGATSATLVLPAIKTADADSYFCTVTNSSGSVDSAVASINVLPAAANPGRLVNLSILTDISTAAPSFTVGTVIGGVGTSGAKPLLVRVAGPSLVPFGVTGTLADPKLNVFSGSTILASNDNWDGDATLATAFTQVGAFAYASAASKDAATYLRTASAGGYTVEVSGVGNGIGTVIAELYDATAQGAFTPSTPRLINVSVLKNIPSGRTLTAGFVVAGATAKTVLVRAIGPGLTPLGVGGVMSDPRLDLFNNAQTVIASNDNWGGDTQLTVASNSVGAFAISDGQSKDAMLLVTLAPGSYTAQVSGTGGTVIVEVYDVP